MSKVLVIEPYRILQQALAIALYPEHDVQLMDVISESLDPQDFDVAIVDAASLREKSALNAQELHTVQGWKLPMIRIDGEASGEDPAQNKVVILKQPISRKALMAALAECLGDRSGRKQNGSVTELEKEPPSLSKETTGKSTGPTARTEPDRFIELTDVVEEGPEGDKTNT
jgi:hypothetical protein